MISSPRTRPSLSCSTMLEGSPLPDLQRLSVLENEAEVVITGEVSSFYLKQMAQESVRAGLAGRKLCNRVIVQCDG